ncbi:hypothetical protein C0992_001130 [Termitomyces sp. T32_za158]|nr:hypothetical protein C0992_001130 [Termitomyces sp. T32_za158]
MDVNTSCQCTALPLLCHRCGAPSHFARRCPLGLKVWFLAPEGQEELLLQLLASQNFTGIPLLDAATLDNLKKEAPGNLADVEAPEEDF